MSRRESEGLNEPSGKHKVQWAEEIARGSMRMTAVAKLSVAVR